MKKEKIRKEFFKLKNKGFSYNQCSRILKAKFEYSIATRTLKRWMGRLDRRDWDLRDKSRIPHTIHKKIDSNVEKEIISLKDEAPNRSRAAGY